MDGFLGKIIEKVTEKATGGSSGGGGDSYSSYNQQPSYGGQGQGYNSGPAPPQDLPYPWVARWDDRDQRWFYVNEQTGERSWGDRTASLSLRMGMKPAMGSRRNSDRNTRIIV
jgi:hypothetical protein